jgi:arylsulfatase A-like enzyme
MAQRDHLAMPANVLLILIDCLRMDRAATAQTHAPTPTLDGVRAAGATFLQAIAAATTTTPCTAAVLTGCYASRHGVRGHSGYSLRPGVTTLAEALAGAGYDTWAEVTGPLYASTGFNRGFRAYNWRERWHYLDSRWGEGVRRRVGEARRPWFGFLHLWDLHLPRRVPRAFDKPEFGQTLYDRAVSALDYQLGRLLAALPEDTLVVIHGDHGEAVNPSMLKARWRNFYMQFVSRLPHAAQRALRPFAKGLKMQKRRRSQMDNLGHGFHVYEYLVRVPLLLRGPGIAAGVAVPDLVRQVDVAPTIVDALGLAWPGPAHGRSLLPLMRGAALPELPAFSDACGRVLLEDTWWRSGIRTSRYKYVFGPHSAEVAEELYDLQADPEERNSLAGELPELAGQLKAQLQRAIADEPD